jgi:hypothetical protein
MSKFILIIFLIINLNGAIDFGNNMELKSIFENRYHILSDIDLDINFISSNNNIIESFNTLTSVNQNSIKDINRKIYKDFFTSSISPNLGKKELNIYISRSLSSIDKIKYSLMALEAIFKNLNIDYIVYKFDIEKEINDLGYLNINNKMRIDLNSVRDRVFYLPFDNKNINFSFSKNFGKITSFGYNHRVFIKNKLVTILYIDNIKASKEKLDDIKLLIDADDKVVKMYSNSYFKHNFLIKSSNYRVNIIGLKRDYKSDESGIIVSYDDLDKNFSIDRDGKIFRVEFYDKLDNFLGLITLNKIGI